MVTKDKKSPNLYLKKYMENSEENMHVDFGASTFNFLSNNRPHLHEKEKPRRIVVAVAKWHLYEKLAYSGLSCSKRDFS